MPGTLKNYRHRGLSLIEVCIVLIVSSVVLVGLFVYGSNALHKSKLRNQAQQFSPWVQAANTYAGVHRSQWLMTAARNYPGARDGNVYWIGPVTASTLQSQYFVPTSAGTNLLGQQQPELLVRLVRQSSLPEGWRVEALLYTKDGQPLSDDDLGLLVASMGTQSGMVTSRDRTVIQGADGSWRAPVADWVNAIQPGHVAWLLGSGAGGSKIGIAEGWLSRVDVPGTQDQNKMETDLGLANNAVSGTPCDNALGLNSNRNGTPLFCVDSKWITGAELLRFNKSKVETVPNRALVVTRQADRDMFLTAQATQSSDDSAAAVYRGCNAVIELSTDDRRTWTRVSESSQRLNHIGSKKNARCSARAYIHRNWWYQVSLNQGYKMPGGGSITTFYSDYSD